MFRIIFYIKYFNANDTPDIHFLYFSKNKFKFRIIFLSNFDAKDTPPIQFVYHMKVSNAKFPKYSLQQCMLFLKVSTSYILLWTLVSVPYWNLDNTFCLFRFNSFLQRYEYSLCSQHHTCNFQIKFIIDLFWFLLI